MNPICQLDNSISMINFVAMGMGCSLLPAYAQSIHQEGVVYKRLEPPTFVRTLAVIKRKGAGRPRRTAVRLHRLAHFREAQHPSLCPATTLRGSGRRR